MSAVAMANWPQFSAMSGGSLSHLPPLGTLDGTDVQQLDLCALAQHAVALMHATGHVKATEVQLELPEEPVLARVNRRRVEQVLFHLLVHALEASPGEGATARAARLTVEPSDDFGDYGPTFRVRYSGRSAVEQTAEDARGTPRRGLSVARKLVEAMGGLLTVRGRGLTGALVTVELPDQGTASW